MRVLLSWINDFAPVGMTRSASPDARPSPVIRAPPSSVAAPPRLRRRRPLLLVLGEDLHALAADGLGALDRLLGGARLHETVRGAVHDQGGHADACEDIGYLMTVRRTHIPPSLQALLAYGTEMLESVPGVRLTSHSVTFPETLKPGTYRFVVAPACTPANLVTPCPTWTVDVPVVIEVTE